MPGRINSLRLDYPLFYLNIHSPVEREGKQSRVSFFGILLALNYIMLRYTALAFYIRSKETEVLSVGGCEHDIQWSVNHA